MTPAIDRVVLPKVNGVSRDADPDQMARRNVVVHFERELTDEELRAFHDLLRMMDELQGRTGTKH